eukprot:g2309.t1
MSSRPAFLTPPRHNPLSYDYGDDGEDYWGREGHGGVEEYEEYDEEYEEEIARERAQGAHDEGDVFEGDSTGRMPRAQQDARQSVGDQGDREMDGRDAAVGGDGSPRGTVSKRAARLFWSRREVLQQKSAWLAKAEHLRKQRANLERSCFKQFFETRTAGLRADVQKLSSEHRLLEGGHTKESRAIASQLSGFREKTMRLRRQIKSVASDLTLSSAAAGSPSRQLDENRQRQLMEDLHATFDALESDVADFKRKGRSRYQELQHEERLLEREMAQFAERCQHWDAAGTDSSSNILRELKAGRGGRGTPQLDRHPASAMATPSPAKSRPQEIVDIERRIEELGGRTGGWDSRDHATFLRLLSRYNLRQPVTTRMSDSGKAAPSPGSAVIAFNVDERRVQSMVSYAATKLPHLSVNSNSDAEDAVRAHWEWFQEFSSLEEQKREAVKRWREQRNKPRSTTKATPSPSSFTTPRRTSTEASTRKHTASSSAWEKRKRESDRKKKELAEWKAKRAAAAARAEAEKKSEEREARLARKRAAAQRAADKEEIAMYRLQREAAEAHQQAVARVLATARGQAPGPPTSGRVLRERHERNMAKVRKKREEKARLKNEEKERKARLEKITEKVNKRVAPDFSRLTRHTTASAHNVLTHEKLDRMEEQRRQNMGGHRATYSSHTGAELSRGKTFTFAKASSLKVPKWRRVAMR